MDWTKIAWVAALVMMAVFIFPAARHWLKHGPRGDAGDWRAAAIPLVLVVGFIFVLIMLVRS